MLFSYFILKAGLNEITFRSANFELQRSFLYKSKHNFCKILREMEIESRKQSDAELGFIYRELKYHSYYFNHAFLTALVTSILLLGFIFLIEVFANYLEKVFIIDRLLIYNFFLKNKNKIFYIKQKCFFSHAKKKTTKYEKKNNIALTFIINNFELFRFFSKKNR